MSEQSRGFTMIELLMVIIIIAVLGATGLTQFLDFRQEARASSVMQTLTAMRVSIKNQFQQALLRCGASTSAGWTVPDGASLSQAIFSNMIYNDVSSFRARKNVTPLGEFA